MHIAPRFGSEPPCVGGQEGIAVAASRQSAANFSGWAIHFGWLRSPEAQLQTEDGALGIGEFFVAAVVSTLVDEFLGGGEIGGGRFPWILFFADL